MIKGCQMGTETELTIRGQTLINDVNACEPAQGQMALWWLGQHSFIVKAGHTILYIDPFLSHHPDRLVPPLVEPQQINHAHAICGSHDHLDHIDRAVWPTIAEASPNARFVAPALIVDTLVEDIGIRIDRFKGLDDGHSTTIADVKLTGIAAAHEFLDQDPATKQYPYLGFVIEWQGCTLYHAGDTCWYDGLQSKLKAFEFDAMLLPINGRDAKRLSAGIIGNMTYQEAADLAGPLQPGLVVPTHYDMFAGNPGDPDAFCEYMQVKYPYAPTHVCRYGQRFTIGEASSS